MKDITGYTTSIFGAASGRYSLGARWFHWLTALLMAIVIPIGWIFAEFKTKQGSQEILTAPFPGVRDDYVNLHKTLGLAILALVVARIVYRLLHRPPALPGRMPALTKGLAHATHWLLYTVLLVMPVSGYILASSSDHPISILGLFDFPKLPVGREQGHTAAAIHLYVQFAVYALIALHVAGVAWHLFVRRDGILDRMLPRQTAAD